MEHNGDIPVVFEHGVFRPTTPVHLPENARFRIMIRPEKAGPTGPGNGIPSGPVNGSFQQLRDRALIRAGNWRPTRDELHERG
ncbi:MAG: antitoxin family protein [Phycisphaerales bacterium]